MPTDQKSIVRYAILSILLIAVLTALSVLAFYPSKSSLGDTFTLGVLYTVVQKMVLYASALVFLLRLTVFNQLFGTFLYVILLVTNIFIGVLAIYLFSFHHYNRAFLHDALWNLLMGFLLLSDITINASSRR